MKVEIVKANQPQWKTVNVKSHIPSSLKKLDEIAHNLWWVWNSDARDLFKSLDPELWRKVGKNPIELLAAISYKRLKEMETNPELIKAMDKVYNDFRTYMDVKPDANRASVAYFCMEYGISHVLKIYSGGLGILAEAKFPPAQLKENIAAFAEAVPEDALGEAERIFHDVDSDLVMPNKGRKG